MAVCPIEAITYANASQPIVKYKLSTLGVPHLGGTLVGKIRDGNIGGFGDVRSHQRLRLVAVSGLDHLQNAGVKPPHSLDLGGGNL